MSRSLLSAIYAMAFCSGLAALVYEVTWARMLGLTFGSTSQSAAAVVAGFMGGMGLGAWLYRHLRARCERVLMLYALLELGIAASAAALTLTLHALPAFVAQLSETIGGGLLFESLRLSGAFLLLAVPAMLMGATYPALCTVAIRSVEGVDRHLGAIYGVNTLGAALGVLAAGLMLIDWLGLRGAAGVGVLINAGVALMAFALLRTASVAREAAFDGPAVPPPESAIPTDLPRTVTGIVLIASGFCTLSYEILWFRALRYTMGTSTYAFTVVLFAFLVGLGLGSLVLRRAARRTSPERDLAFIQLLIAVFALAATAAYFALAETQALFEALSFRSAAVKSRPWLWRLAINGGFAAVTMLPATIFMGLSFPMATRLFLGDVRRLDSRVGTAYLLANIGGIFGAVGAAVVLLPLVGTIDGTKLCAVVNVALAALILLILPHSRAARRIATVCAAGVAVAIVAVPSAAPLRGEKLTDDVDGRVLFSEEGDLATVQVLEDPGDTTRRAMAINGIKIGWSEGFRGTSMYRKQLLLIHLPMALDSGIRHALNVGLGSAATLQALARYPQIESATCVEISGAVVRASRLFAESRVLQDERVSLEVEDALHYLLRSGPRYDLIVSDGKQDQLHSANASVLCREYYEKASARLGESGLMAQWLQLRMLHDDFRIALRTVCSVFNDVELFFFAPNSVLLIASNRSIADRVRLTQEQYREIATEGMSDYFLHSTAAVIGHWVAGREQLTEAVGDGPISTWDHLILDASPFRAPAEAWRQASAENLALLIGAERLARTDPAVIATPGEQAYLNSQRLFRRALLAADGKPGEARRLAQKALRLNSADGEVRFYLDRMSRR